MHWLDPDHLPHVTANVERFLLDPHPCSSLPMHFPKLDYSANGDIWDRSEQGEPGYRHTGSRRQAEQPEQHCQRRVTNTDTGNADRNQKHYREHRVDNRGKKQAARGMRGRRAALTAIKLERKIAAGAMLYQRR